MDEQHEMMLYIKELETKVEEKDRIIALYENIIEKFDSNLKLSIQSSHPSTRNNNFQKNISRKLFETITNNLKNVSDEIIRSILEEAHPALPHCVKLLVKALQNEKEEHGQLVVVTTSTFCKYMNENGEVALANISTIFDQICSKVYERCKPVIMNLCDSTSDQLNTSYITDTEYNKDNHRYNNIMMFHNTKFKNKMLKEIMPMLR
jgi:hypothetical protein